MCCSVIDVACVLGNLSHNQCCRSLHFYLSPFAAEHLRPFFSQWVDYLKQLHEMPGDTFGKPIAEDDLNLMTDDAVVQ
jgi:hypothetical protein